jgi:MFS transporter, DHA1 family, tetracycline resistance protein
MFSLISPGSPFAVSALLVLPALWLAVQVKNRSPKLA